MAWQTAVVAAVKTRDLLELLKMPHDGAGVVGDVDGDGVALAEDSVQCFDYGGGGVSVDLMVGPDLYCQYPITKMPQ